MGEIHPSALTPVDVEQMILSVLNDSMPVSSMHRLAKAVLFLFNEWEKRPIGDTHSHAYFERRVLQLLAHMEEHLSGQDAALARVETNTAALKQMNADLAAAFSKQAEAQANANSRLEADIEALRNEIGSGNTTRLTAIADSLEASLGQFKTIQTNLEANAAAEDAVDVLTVSPTTATVAPGATQQFTANMPVTWTAGSGSIGTDGLYTAPTNGATSDTVTATTTEGKTASASVTIA